MGLIVIEEIEDGVQWTSDGRTSHTATSLEALMEKLVGPHAIVCEPSFYDGLREVRRVLGEILARGGHRLVPVTRGAKAMLEVAAGDDGVGSGVCGLFSIATATTDRLDRLRTGVENRWDMKDALDVLHAIDTVQASTSNYALAVAAAGPYDALDEPLKGALGDGLNYRRDVLLAAYRAATAATSRSEFEQFLGLNASGHGAMTQTLRSWYVERNTTDHFERDSVLAWSDYRRALRFVYHRIKEDRRGVSRAA